MLINKTQMKIMEQAIFLEKLKHAFCRDIQAFSALNPDKRDEFLVACFYSAESNGLVTEQGIASYALAAWWLGIGFEKKSKNMQALFNSKFPEVRKVVAMNEWAHVLIGEPDNLAKAEERLKQCFYQTEAWGR